ncbi:MAG: ABC transporter ATP-binding protein [Steroidobacteraceae bacterium]
MLRQVLVTDAERRLDQYPHELSGGMRQRVMIAIALACDPAVLIADEPTTALDVTIQAQILALLAELKRARGMAMALITHDLGVVAGVADRVAVMYGGRIVELGTVDQVLKSPQHPYTRALLASMPRLDAPETARLQAIAGQPPNPRSLPAGCAFHPRCDLATELCSRQRPELANSWPRVACHHAQVSTNTAGSDS